MLIITFTTIHCSRGPLKSKEDLFRATSAPEIFDAWSEESFALAIKQNIDYLNKNPDHLIQIGDFSCKNVDYASKLNEVLKLIESKQDWKKFIADNFHWYEVYGKNDWGEVLVTGYFEPVIAGSNKPSDKFSHPLLAEPKEMIRLDLKKFTPFMSEKLAKVVLEENKTNIKIYQTPKGELLPFPDREGLSKIPASDWKNPPLAWVDPVDAFFLQIQGSGTIQLEKQSLRVGYADQNGYAYTPIGKYLLDKIPLENMSMQAIEAELRAMPPADRDSMLNKNQSYVFMKPLNQNAITYAGVPAIGGRTVATDKDLFPKGALAFLRIKKADDTTLSQFVFDHDTGGAIKGPARVDLFTGRGDEAKAIAGPLKNTGTMYYLIPKQNSFD